MSEDVWTAKDTNPDAIEAALREMLRARHAENETLAPARVLNLVVVVDREWKGEIANRLERLGRYHASRTVLCAVEEGRTSLDATAVMSYDERAGASFGVIRERIEIDLGPQQLARLDTIVDPVLMSELPTVLWCPHGHEAAIDALRSMIDVMLIDSDDLVTGDGGLDRAASFLDDAYVVDLAWLRTTPWRERLASSFDPPARRRALQRIAALEIRHRPSSTASAGLLAGWLASRLGWDLPDGPVAIGLLPVMQDAPGLAGITVTCASGFSLSLDRAAGGLCARQRTPDGEEAVWQILGASRGEGGILGEGVRQALLRDPTYGPALAAAREMAA